MHSSLTLHPFLVANINIDTESSDRSERSHPTHQVALTIWIIIVVTAVVWIPLVVAYCKLDPLARRVNKDARSSDPDFPACKCGSFCDARTWLCGSNCCVNYRSVTWWRVCAPRDLAHATNNRNSRPSTYSDVAGPRNQVVDVKAWTGWTVVQRSTTPSRIRRIRCKPYRTEVRLINSELYCSENGSQRASYSSQYMDIYSSSWWLQLKLHNN